MATIQSYGLNAAGAFGPLTSSDELGAEGGADLTLRAATILRSSAGAVSLYGDNNTTTITIGGGTSNTLITIGGSGITTDFPSGSTVDFAGASVTGFSGSGGGSFDFLNVGTSADAVASGDFSAGLTGAGRLFYDQSADLLRQYNSSGAQTFGMDGSSLALVDSSGDTRVIMFHAGSSQVRPPGYGVTTSARMGMTANSDTNCALTGWNDAGTIVTSLEGAIGYLRLGANTTAVAEGDLSAGDGTNEMFWDASAGELSVDRPANDLAILRVRNTTAGTAAGSYVIIEPDSGGLGTKQLILSAFSTSHSTQASQARIFATTAMTGGLHVGANSGGVHFYAGEAFETAQTKVWRIQSTLAEGFGHFVPATTNTYDIGSSTLKPRDVFIGRSLGVGSSNATGATGDIIAGDGTSTLTWDASIPQLSATLPNSGSIRTNDSGYAWAFVNRNPGTNSKGGLRLDVHDSAAARAAGLGGNNYFLIEGWSSGWFHWNYEHVSEPNGHSRFDWVVNRGTIGNYWFMGIGNTASPSTAQPRLELFDTSGTVRCYIDPGAATVVAGDTLRITGSANGGVFSTIVNTDAAGGSAHAGWRVENDAGDTGILRIFGGTHPESGTTQLTGNAGPLSLSGGTGTFVGLQIANSFYWYLNGVTTGSNTVGHIIAAADNAYDIGSRDGGTVFLRPRTLYVGTQVRVEGLTAAATAVFTDGSANGNIQNQVRNTNTGALATAEFRVVSDTAVGQFTSRSSGHGSPNQTSVIGSHQLWLASGTGENLILGAALGEHWFVNGSTAGSNTVGHLCNATDNTYDIGSRDGGTTDLRPRTVYAGTSIEIGTTTGSSAAGDLQAGDGTNELFWDASDDLLTLTGTGNNLAGISGDSGSAHFAIRDVAGNTTFNGLLMQVHNTSGIGGPGLGGVIGWQAEHDGSVSGPGVESQGSIRMIWRDATQSTTGQSPTAQLEFEMKRGDPLGFPAKLLVLGNTTTATGNARAEFGNNAGTRTVTIDMDQESLQIGQSASTPTGAGDVVAGDGTRELLWDASIPTLVVTGNNAIGSQNTVHVADDDAGIIVQSFNNVSATASATLTLTRARGTVAVGADTAANDTLGRVIGSGWASGANASGAEIRFVNDGVFTPAVDSRGRIRLMTVSPGAWASTSSKWEIDSNGHLTAGTDNSWDIGSEDGGTTPLRPRTVYVGTSLNVGNGITPSTANGDFVFGDGTRTASWDASAGLMSISGGTTAADYLRITGSANNGVFATIVNSDSVSANPHAGWRVENDNGDRGLLRIFGGTHPESGTTQLTGNLGPLTLSGGAGTFVSLQIANSTYWSLNGVTTGSNTVGHIIAQVDNSYDIGSRDGGTTPLRPRTIYAGTSVEISGLTAAGDPFDATGAANGTIRAHITNTDAGSAAVAEVRVQGDSAIGQFRTLSTGHPDGAGVGVVTAANLHFASSGSSIDFRTGGTGVGSTRWRILASGSGSHLVTVADNTYDIGASGATRPRTIYVGTSLEVGTTTGSSAAGDLQAGDGTRELFYDASTNTVSINGAASTISSDDDLTLTAVNTAATTPVVLAITVDNTGATSGDSTLDLNVTSTNGAGNLDIDVQDLVTIDSTGFSIDGTGGTSNVSNAGALSISTSGGGALTVASAVALSLDSGAGTIETDATAFTADAALTITATSAILSLDGTGIETSATTITADAGLAIATTTTGALSLDSGTTGAVNLGTGASAKTITIGNTTGATGVVYDAGSGGHAFTGNIGFYGTTPVAQSAAYSVSNAATDRTYDANSTTLNELADVLATLIADLQATGLIG